MIAALIAKDLRAYKSSIFGNFLFGIVFVFLNVTLNAIGADEFVAYSAVFILTANIALLLGDKKGGVDLLTFSLPVTRTQIVKARYLAGFVICFIGVLVWIAAAALLVNLSENFDFAFRDIFSWKLGFSVLAFFLVQMSICFPAYFKLNMIGTMICFIVSTLIPLLLIITLGREVKDAAPGADAFIIYAAIFLLFAGFMTGSYFLSRAINRRREL